MPSDDADTGKEVPASEESTAGAELNKGYEGLWDPLYIVRPPEKSKQSSLEEVGEVVGWIHPLGLLLGFASRVVARIREAVRR